MIFNSFRVCIVFLSIILVNLPNANGQSESNRELYDIEGTVMLPNLTTSWLAETVIQLKGGEAVGFLRKNGSFLISKVPSGSYIVEVVNPNYVYEPIRVEINSKGKYRARKVNYIQSSHVHQMPYPLEFVNYMPAKYFYTREQWKVTDFLFNSMVLTMVLPLLAILVLPKLMNDPETKKEMEQLTNLKHDMPEMSEMITSFFTGNSPTAEKQKEKNKAIKSSKKSNKNN
ncbi:ER membrane protein complex subunit 7 homolog [Rhopalosiphum maidis]|uniref:ER membrane protein complex subunit 7 homolog n=1 Tax=Rhopalosiphum maidis TaxID=43146 RepID=UPI000EFF42A0|nr:ER membrane protein complex subunit 7 homolog [Rhopalosiphum maidis]XP_060833400.1 ER membrane protein complex subunit 7 homolog [Rhopalosiphum padi]